MPGFCKKEKQKPGVFCMILAAVVKWVAGRRVDNYNLQAAYPISYAVGYEVSYKNHYYLIPDLMKIADSKMYQDKAYKKEKSETAGMSAEIPEGIAQSVSGRWNLLRYSSGGEPDRIISHATTRHGGSQRRSIGNLCVFRKN